MALAAAWYLAWEAAHRGVYAYNQSIYPLDDVDEWRYTACSRLVAHGYSLFDQVFSAQPPLLFASLAAGMRLTGDSIAGARWTEIAFGLVGLLSAAWLAYLLAGGAAAALAALVLAISPVFLVYSHTVEAEGPMMALTTLSLALLLLSTRRRWPALAALSGLALAGAVLLKLFALEALLPAMWLLLGQIRTERRFTMQAGVAFLLGTALPVALDFALLSPRQQWAQVIELHNAAATAQLPGLDSPVHVLWQFAGFDAGLFATACIGLCALGIQRHWPEFGFCGLWLGGTVAMLLAFRPLFPHHPAILSTSLAASAAVGVVLATRGLPGRGKIVPLAVAGVVYAAFLPRLLHADRHLLLATPSPIGLPLAVWVRTHSSPSDFVVVDDLRIADGAGRLVPPPLCDPSTVRRRAGYLTGADAIDATRRYHARLVVPSADIYLQIPGYLTWVQRFYRSVSAPGSPAFSLR